MRPPCQLVHNVANNLQSAPKFGNPKTSKSLTRLVASDISICNISARQSDITWEPWWKFLVSYIHTFIRKIDMVQKLELYKNDMLFFQPLFLTKTMTS